MGRGSGIAVSCDVDYRHGSALVLLWLWCGPAAAVLIQPLAWELPYAVGIVIQRHTYIHTYINCEVKLKLIDQLKSVH